MIGLILAGLAGASFGFCFHKGRICYASAFSDFFLIRSSRVGGGILLATLLTMISWSVAFALRGDTGFWLPPWGWYALVGGSLFGFGMILSGACLSSTLWRVASGSGQYALVLGGVATGFVLTGFAHPWLTEWYFTPLWLGTGGSLFELSFLEPFGIDSPIFAPLLALVVSAIVVVIYAGLAGSMSRQFDGDSGDGRISAVAIGLSGLYDGANRYVRTRVNNFNLGQILRNPWDPRSSGLGIALTATVWMALDGVWTVSGPLEDWLALTIGALSGDALRIIPGLAATFPGEITTGMAVVGGFVVGAFVSSVATGDFSLDPPSRSVGIAPIAGGVLMGVGAHLAPGCNVTNLYTGIASLSFHGLFAATGIVLGAYAGTRILFRPRG